MLEGVAKAQGFTLVELLTTLVVVVTMLSLGVPAISSLRDSGELAAVSNSLMGAVNLARSEAVTRGVPVTICKLKADENPAVIACEDETTATDWSAGWLVFEDPDENGVLDNADDPPAEELIRLWRAPPGNAAILAVDEDDNGLTSLRFDPFGANTARKRARLTIANPDCTGNQARVISISVAGRISKTMASCP